eukprot:284280-Pleurochrysis_carterae.AAC.1
MGTEAKKIDVTVLGKEMRQQLRDEGLAERKFARDEILHTMSHQEEDTHCRMQLVERNADAWRCINQVDVHVLVFQRSVELEAAPVLASFVRLWDAQEGVMETA